MRFSTRLLNNVNKKDGECDKVCMVPGSWVTDCLREVGLGFSSLSGVRLEWLTDWTGFVDSQNEPVVAVQDCLEQLRGELNRAKDNNKCQLWKAWGHDEGKSENDRGHNEEQLRRNENQQTEAKIRAYQETMQRGFQIRLQVEDRAEGGSWERIRTGACAVQPHKLELVTRKQNRKDVLLLNSMFLLKVTNHKFVSTKQGGIVFL